MNEEFNGWTNWETWNVLTWLTNDEGTDAEARAIVRESSPGEAERNLEDWVSTSLNPTAEASLGWDLLESALDKVNWAEICTALAAE